MTLYLQVCDRNNIPKKSIIYVTGSQAGPLYSKDLGERVFKITCNKNDTLQFTIFEDDFTHYGTGKVIGQNSFNCQRFIEENRFNQALFMQSQEDPFTYQFNIYKDEDEKRLGTIKLLIRYDPTQLFVGQTSSGFKTLPQKPPVTIFKGKCQSKNLFSFFDSGNQDQNFHFFEETYRDQTWGQAQE